MVLLLEGLASRVRQLGRESTMVTSPPAPPVRAALAQLGSGLDAALAEASRCLAADRAPEPFADTLELSLASLEGVGLAHLEAGIRQEVRGVVREDGEAAQAAVLSAVVLVLRDVVSLLRRIEEALVGLANEDGESKGGGASEAAPVAARERFRVDPIRLQLALRAGIAGGGVIVAMLAMGWSISEDILALIMAPIVAFILAAASSTRGAGTMLATGLIAGILLGWLIADLSLVFLFHHGARMPLSLVYPFVVAGGAGYLIVRGSPLGPLGALFGMLAAILPVFLGDAPPQDVDASYSLVCGLLLGVAAGLIAQRVLWPRTAMQTFTERAAAQLDLCVRALRPGEQSTEGAASGQDTATLVSAYAKQLTLLGQLHAQAHAEPVERGLDDTRRAELLALTQDLFDASLHAQRWRVGKEAAVPQSAAAALAPLREALTHLADAIVASLIAAASALRGSGPEPDHSLGEARAAVEAQLDALRGRTDLARAGDPRRAGDFLAQLAATRQLVDSELRIEAWLADWSQARRQDPSGSNPRA